MYIGDHYWSSHWFSNKQHYLSHVHLQAPFFETLFGKNCLPWTYVWTWTGKQISQKLLRNCKNLSIIHDILNIPHWHFWNNSRTKLTRTCMDGHELKYNCHKLNSYPSKVDYSNISITPWDFASSWLSCKRSEICYQFQQLFYKCRLIPEHFQTHNFLKEFTMCATLWIFGHKLLKR